MWERVRIMPSESREWGAVADGRGAGAAAAAVVACVVGWRCSGDEHVALRLVATPWWHKGTDLNTKKLLFKRKLLCIIIYICIGIPPSLRLCV